MNPIELVWNDLKYFLASFYKPNNLTELISGIQTFWSKFANVAYCNKKIDHVYKVIDKVILLNGRASGM